MARSTGGGFVLNADVGCEELGNLITQSRSDRGRAQARANRFLGDILKSELQFRARLQDQPSANASPFRFELLYGTT